MGKDRPSLEECHAMGMTCACYNLRRASRAVTQVFDAYFGELDMKATQFTVLAAVAYESAGRPTVNDLADALVLDQSSLSRSLTVLDRLGYVRLVAGDDKRERIVTLTRAGRAALVRGYPVWQKAQSAIAEVLDPKELEMQLRTLRRLTRRAQTLRLPGSREEAKKLKNPRKTADATT